MYKLPKSGTCNYESKDFRSEYFNIFVAQNGYGMISRFSICCVLLLMGSCTSTRDQHGEWISLFNGRDLGDWIVKVHHHEAGVNFGETFRAEDGVIKVRYDQYGDFNDQFAHLYYKTPFSRFHLKLEYRFHGELQKGAPEYTILNSGVMFHSQDPRTMPKEQNWPISVEMQFLAALPQFASGENAPLIGVMLLSIHAVLGFVWLSFIALTASRARTIAWNSNVVRWLEGAVGAFFLAMAGRLVVAQR